MWTSMNEGVDMRRIMGYSDFLPALREAGFSVGSGQNKENMYSVLQWGWGEEPPYPTPVQWFSGDDETDPWSWHMRVLAERPRIGYGKVFFRKAGYITEEYAPYFLAVRRVKSFAQAYADGEMSAMAKRIYDAVDDGGDVPVHILKQIIGFTREEKSAFDRTLIELQMKMFITISGSAQRYANYDGWASTVFSTAERFWGGDVFMRAKAMDAQKAMDMLLARVAALSPAAERKKAEKFIRG